MPTPTEILKQLNWIDVFAVIVLLRIGYIAVKLGVISEIFKLLGTVLAVYLSLHFYERLAGQMGAYPGIGNLPQSFLIVSSCIILALAGYVLFRIMHFLFTKFIKAEPAALFNRWGGLFLGVLRGCLLAGLIFFIMAASGGGYLRTSIKKSYAGERLFRIAPATYTALWQGAVSHFSPGEKSNQGVSEVINAVSSRKN